ncbi:MAG: EamA family transporter [Candidatus Limnocylindrales bacterium]
MVLGLLSAVTWGAGDFCGGLISRYTSTFSAVFTAQVVGWIGILLFVAVAGEAAPTAETVIFGVAAGAFGVSGLVCFYYALGRGTMGVIAPLAALIGAGVPVLLTIYNGELVSLARLGGIGLALAAVVLISLPAGEKTADERRRLRIDFADLPLVVLSGLGFAGFFVFIGHASAGGGLWWPLAIVRTTGVLMIAAGFGYLMLRARPAHLRERVGHVLGTAHLRHWPFSRLALITTFVVAGVGDLGGNVFFVLAQHADAFSVAVVLSSLYPVFTTVLAVLLLHERLRRFQVVGVVLATLSVALLR